MTARPATREFICRKLGDLDDLTVDQILAMGPSIADVIEAAGLLSDIEELDNQDLMDTPPSILVTQIVALVRDSIQRSEEEEDMTPA